MGAALPEERVQRRLAAILAADVVGYSAIMQRAEEATYAAFERLKRDLIAPSLSRHDGRLIKTTGDGALAEFASPLAAVRCATEMQDHLAEGSGPFKLRIGLNLGDVIVGQDGDLYGDGINIAVRLEGIADPGGILISEKVYSEVEGKLDVGFEGGVCETKPNGEVSCGSPIMVSLSPPVIGAMGRPVHRTRKTC
jgi:adenylate cyclase